MKGLFLSAMYDSIQYDIGPIISYVLVFLMVMWLIYVMAKYLNTRPD